MKQGGEWMVLDSDGHPVHTGVFTSKTEALKIAKEARKLHGEKVRLMRRSENPSRFDKCVAEVSKRKGVTSPRGVCATAGRKKYGKKKFQAMAAAGKRKAKSKPSSKRNAPATKGLPIASVVHGKSRADIFQQAKQFVVKIAGGVKKVAAKSFQTLESAMKWARTQVKVLAKNPTPLELMYGAQAIETVGGKDTLTYKLLSKLKKKNPLNKSEQMFEVFHGYPSSEVIEFHTQEHHHEYLAGIGPLISMTVANQTGTRVMELFAPDPAKAKPEDVVQVAVSENGRQMYFVGGDQSLDIEYLIKEFGMHEDDVRDHMKIGSIKKLTYRTRKTFELGGKEEIDFYHKLGGEHAKGILPDLEYKPLNPSMEIVGGRYFIAPPEKSLGNVSPGIVG